MEETAKKTMKESRVGKAITNVHPLLPRLGRYVNDGRFCIDNNLVENAVRPLALGKELPVLRESRRRCSCRHRILSGEQLQSNGCVDPS